MDLEFAPIHHYHPTKTIPKSRIDSEIGVRHPLYKLSLKEQNVPSTSREDQAPLTAPLEQERISGPRMLHVRSCSTSNSSRAARPPYAMSRKLTFPPAPTLTMKRNPVVVTDVDRHPVGGDNSVCQHTPGSAAP
jgi:hypothetical protein